VTPPTCTCWTKRFVGFSPEAGLSAALGLIADLAYGYSILDQFRQATKLYQLLRRVG
jgi:hypothetical protein